MGEEEAAENKNNMTIFRVGERKGGRRKQKQFVVFLHNIHQLLNFLIKACHTHSNMLQ
jgi:hypothetical protein